MKLLTGDNYVGTEGIILAPSKKTTIKIFEDAYNIFLKTYKFRKTEIDVDYVILDNVVNRYWQDVERLKCFHGTEYIDCHKIAAYLTYWTCKLLPFKVGKTAHRLKSANLVNQLIAFIISAGRINDV